MSPLSIPRAVTPVESESAPDVVVGMLVVRTILYEEHHNSRLIVDRVAISARMLPAYKYVG